MLSKSLVLFSVEGWGCVPSLLFDWGQTKVEVMKIMATSFKRSHAGTATLSAPSPAAGHHRPRLRQRLLDTPGQVWVSPVWGHCSFLLGPGAQGSVVPSKSLFPSPLQVLAALRWVNGDLLQEGLCQAQVCCTQSPRPCGSPLPARTSAGDARTQLWLSLCGSLGPGALVWAL